jgi:hypothetical protein
MNVMSYAVNKIQREVMKEWRQKCLDNFLECKSWRTAGSELKIAGFLDSVRRPEFLILLLISSCLEFRLMDKVQKPGSSENFTPTSEPFRAYIKLTPHKQVHADILSSGLSHLKNF